MSDVDARQPIWVPSAGDTGELRLEARMIDQLTLDYGMHFTIEGGVNLTIETSLTLTDGELVRTIDPAKPSDADIAAVYHRLRSTIRDARVEAHCTLVLRFLDGVRLEVPGEQDFEAWQFATRAGERLIALPSGGLAYWSPDVADTTANGAIESHVVPAESTTRLSRNVERKALRIDDYETMVASSVGVRDGLAVEVSRWSDGEVLAEIFRDDLTDTISMVTNQPLPLAVARAAMRNALDRL